jgi:hypothetical protein
MLSHTVTTNTESNIAHLSLSIEGASEELRFKLLCSNDAELKDIFAATFKTVRSLRDNGYSEETIQEHEAGLIEVLMEMRVRGLEADSRGNIYNAPTFVPVPNAYQQARKRQINRLKQMHQDHLLHLCAQTMSNAVRDAQKLSKTHTF